MKIHSNFVRFCFGQILLLCFHALLWCDLATDSVYLTWQASPATTMTIQWISPPEQTKTVVFYRSKIPPLPDENCPQPALLPLTTALGEVFALPGAPQYLVHRVELKNLLPDTDYLFKVSPYEQEFGFHTAPANLDDREIRFVIGGDMYHDAIECMNRTSRQAAKSAPLFALIGGDIAYAVKSIRHRVEETDRWIEWVKAWHATMVTPNGNLVPVIAAVGNHDVIGQYNQTPAQAAVFSALFPMPGRQIYNVLDFGSYLAIFLLDSGHANPIAGKQTAWLEKELQNHKNTLYKFAIYHVPAYPSVRDYFNNPYSAGIRRNWIPLFETGGIFAAFEHHDHAYKRSFPLLKNRVNPQGIIYLGDGGWGVEKPRQSSNYQRRYYLAKSLAVRHFILTTLKGSQVKFEAINDEGQIVDVVSLKGNVQCH